MKLKEKSTRGLLGKLFVCEKRKAYFLLPSFLLLDDGVKILYLQLWQPLATRSPKSKEGCHCAKDGEMERGKAPGF